MWIRLNEAVTSPLSIRLPVREDGATHWRYVSLAPDKEYEFDDDVAEIALNYEARQKYTEERENLLKETGCRYEVKTCKVCGGKRTDIIYYPVERA